MKTIAGNSYLIKKDNQCFVDNLPISKLTDEFETPLMIIIKNRIIENINTFKRVFNEVFNNFECFYSFKANYLLEVCEIVKNTDIGAELVTLPELTRALELNFPPNKIIVGGPYLSKDLLLKALKNQVKEIIIYNLNDIKKVNQIASDLNIKQNVCLRINSQKYDSRLGLSLNEENIKELKTILNSCENISLTTILSHFTTQMNSLSQFKANLGAIIKAQKLLKKYQIHVNNINLGGGFPESTVMPEHVLKNIAINIKKMLQKSEVTFNSIYFEPGRYFVGDAGIYIAQILNLYKDEWIFLDIGNNICPKFARCSLRFYNLSRINEAHKYKISIAGIVPTDQDVLAKDYFLTQDLKIGDKILITNVGAYCLTFSTRFPYQLPKILLVDKDNYKVIFEPKKDHDFSLV
jgi:diaminopimelate decarboxylase